MANLAILLKHCKNPSRMFPWEMMKGFFHGLHIFRVKDDGIWLDKQFRNLLVLPKGKT
jgi:hypothetical protein